MPGRHHYFPKYDPLLNTLPFPMRGPFMYEIPRGVIWNTPSRTPPGLFGIAVSRHLLSYELTPPRTSLRNQLRLLNNWTELGCNVSDLRFVVCILSSHCLAFRPRCHAKRRRKTPDEAPRPQRFSLPRGQYRPELGLMVPLDRLPCAGAEMNGSVVTKPPPTAERRTSASLALIFFS